MIERIIILSLIITGIHVVFQQGNMLSSVRVLVANWLDNTIGKKWSCYVQKPLWCCIPCMASVWTIVLTWDVDVFLICAVCGLNLIISRIIEQEETVELQEVNGFAIPGKLQETEYMDDVPTISRHKTIAYEKKPR